MGEMNIFFLINRISRVNPDEPGNVGFIQQKRSREAEGLTG